MKEKFNFQVEGVPLIKFQDAEKIKKLQSGKIYAKTLGYYRKREEETGDCEVGDKYEGMMNLNNAFIYSPDENKIVSANDKLFKTSESDDFVFCMFGIDPNLEKFKLNKIAAQWPAKAVA